MPGAIPATGAESICPIFRFSCGIVSLQLHHHLRLSDALWFLPVHVRWLQTLFRLTAAMHFVTSGAQDTGSVFISDAWV
jgi:hypothetical protein